MCISISEKCMRSKMIDATPTTNSGSETKDRWV